MPDDPNVIRRVNDLLSDLCIPISIQTPQHLAPTLLIAILESILQQRIPLSLAARECRTHAGRIEAMKVFLGILGDDLLQHDLTMIDPQKLANGELKETRLISHLLSELYQNARLKEYTIGCGHSGGTPDMSAHEPDFVSEFVKGQMLDNQVTMIAHPSLGANQIPFMLSNNAANDSLEAGMNPPRGSSVRQDGWMEGADEVGDLSIIMSASNRSFSMKRKPLDDASWSPLSGSSTLPVGVTQQTLYLLQERASLLEELAYLSQAEAQSTVQQDN